jgi:hypothetical protein
VHDITGVHLHRHTAGLYKQLAFNHKVVFAVWMLIAPRLRRQFPLEEGVLLGTAALEP